MNNREFFIQRWEAEQPAFRRVLAALPAEQLAYKPHERCTSAGSLAWQLAMEQHDLVNLLDTGATEYVPSQHPQHEDILTAWDRSTEEVRQRLAKADDSKWEGKADFSAGGAVVWTDTIQNMLWGFLFDMVHHRGQLSSYIRPMGGKVPSIYGPSADATS